jgi:toxin-antitoxin system PIN domain toxin
VIAVDTNILVFAHRRHLAPHRQAVAWLRALAEGKSPWGMPVFCIGEFVRIVTHPGVFDPPSTLRQATSALRSVLGSPTVRILKPSDNFPTLYEEALERADARGNMAFIAQIAAVCREHGAAELLTMDRDFARFDNLHLISLEEAPPA